MDLRHVLLSNANISLTIIWHFPLHEIVKGMIIDELLGWSERGFNLYENFPWNFPCDSINHLHVGAKMYWVEIMVSTVVCLLFPLFSRFQSNLPWRSSVVGCFWCTLVRGSVSYLPFDYPHGTWLFMLSALVMHILLLWFILPKGLYSCMLDVVLTWLENALVGIGYLIVTWHSMIGWLIDGVENSPFWNILTHMWRHNGLFFHIYLGHLALGGSYNNHMDWISHIPILLLDMSVGWCLG